LVSRQECDPSQESSACVFGILSFGILSFFWGGVVNVKSTREDSSMMPMDGVVEAPAYSNGQRVMYKISDALEIPATIIKAIPVTAQLQKMYSPNIFCHVKSLNVRTMLKLDEELKRYNLLPSDGTLTADHHVMLEGQKVYIKNNFVTEVSIVRWNSSEKKYIVNIGLEYNNYTPNELAKHEEYHYTRVERLKNLESHHKVSIDETLPAGYLIREAENQKQAVELLLRQENRDVRERYANGFQNTLDDPLTIQEISEYLTNLDDTVPQTTWKDHRGVKLHRFITYCVYHQEFCKENLSAFRHLNSNKAEFWDKYYNYILEQLSKFLSDAIKEPSKYMHWLKFLIDRHTFWIPVIVTRANSRTDTTVVKYLTQFVVNFGAVCSTNIPQKPSEVPLRIIKNVMITDFKQPHPTVATQLENIEIGDSDASDKVYVTTPNGGRNLGVVEKVSPQVLKKRLFVGISHGS
jgi:hypothetical protein